MLYVFNQGIISLCVYIHPHKLKSCLCPGPNVNLKKNKTKLLNWPYSFVDDPDPS